MPSQYPLLVSMPPERQATQERPRLDLGVPNYDRSNDRGNYLVMSLDNGKVNFSSYCPTFSRALAMTRLSKRHPTWVLSGLEEELLVIKRICGVKAEWITADILNKLLRSQLGKTVKVVTTFNFRE